MNTGLHLGEFATTPLYNIKAVVQATNISPSTLRAWERRYDIARPERSESGYRLYSERDIAVIRWLKSQVEAGMSISQAVTWLSTITESGEAMAEAVLPVAGNGTPLHDPASIPSPHARHAVRDLAALQDELLLAMMQFDEQAAEAAIAEAFALYPVEQVGDKLIIPLLAEMSERRQRGEFGPTAEHFANSYLIQRLGTLLRSIPNGAGTPLLWVGGTHTKLDEAGGLLLSIYLRRAGYHVHYLGQNLPVEGEAMHDLLREAQRHQPAMILFCANSPLAAKWVGQLSMRLSETNQLPAIVGYVGAVFTRNPELLAATAGVYMGAHAQEGVQKINELLADRHHADHRYDKKRYTNRSVADRIAATK